MDVRRGPEEGEMVNRLNRRGRKAFNKQWVKMRKNYPLASEAELFKLAWEAVFGSEE